MSRNFFHAFRRLGRCCVSGACRYTKLEESKWEAFFMLSDDLANAASDA